MNDEPIEPLSPELEALVAKLPAAAKAGASKAVVWGRIASSASAVGGAVAATTGAAITAKVVAPLVAIALVGGVGAGVALDRTVLAPEPKVIVKTERVEIPVRVEVPVPVETPVAAPEPERIEQARVTPVQKPRTLAEERQLIEAARTALIKRNASGALDSLALHRRQFRKGQLAEERDALEIQGLAQAGRLEEARAAARAFLSTYPRSVFGPAVDSAVK